MRAKDRLIGTIRSNLEPLSKANGRDLRVGSNNPKIKIFALPTGKRHAFILFDVPKIWEIPESPWEVTVDKDGCRLSGIPVDAVSRVLEISLQELKQDSR